MGSKEEEEGRGKGYRGADVSLACHEGRLEPTGGTLTHSDSIVSVRFSYMFILFIIIIIIYNNQLQH